MRSLLTTLGIIVGVSTVIAMVSIIDGINKYVYNVLGGLGTSTVYVQKYKWILTGRLTPEEMRKLARTPDFTLEDAQALKKLDEVEMVSAVQPVRSLTARYKEKNIDVDPSGVDPEYLAIAGYELASGRPLIDNDILYKNNVAIIGDFVKERLFGDEDPVGKEIWLDRYKFIVIGVLKPKGQLLGQNLDNVILIPVTTAMKLWPIRGRFAGPWRIYRSLQIVVKVRSDIPLEKGIEAIESLLRARRGLRFDEDNNFYLNTSEMLVSAYKQITGGIFIAMIAIASMALIVGGIGIMNIMLVSVTERTREIGVRKAVGATQKDILLLFLTEAVLLTLIGGLIGVLIGIAFGKLVDLLTPLPASIPFWSVIVGIGFSTLVGIFFGIYPARKAAKLNPVEALRYE
ncbi:MAG: ABC transporter permease [Candidatus Hydrothermia bacterium]